LIEMQSQRPAIAALQQRLYFQLTKDHMPKEHVGSADDQQMCLVKYAVGKVLLICIDDCWEAAHYVSWCFSMVVF
jgi:hypothetical protein